jgi:hypothetical protein
VERGSAAPVDAMAGSATVKDRGDDDPGSRRRPAACRLAAALAALALAAAVPAAVAGGDTAARVQAGIRLFRSLMAADTGLDQRADAEGRLVVLVFYATDVEAADRVAVELAAPPEGQASATIRDLPVSVELSSDPGLSAYQQHPPAAIFIAEAPRDEALRRVVRYGVENGVIVFSPFEGHVEKGVTGGISVEARVQPYLNAATLEDSGIELKPFFLKVSRFAR